MAGGSTIFALSSGAGLAAISVIRVSGPQAMDGVVALAGAVPKPKTVRRRILRARPNGQPIDEAMVLWLPGPATFTGEDCAEFHVHGGRAVVARVLEELARFDGYQLAEPGEFTKRAFQNGKLDLMSVEGLADLISAETEEQRRQAWFHKSGSAGEAYENWRRGLIAVLASMEAAIDFSDQEDVEALALTGSFDNLERVREELAEALSPENAGEAIRDGVRVVLAGPANVGKSSLLNALARREAAIVSPIAGTTRDAIEVRMYLGGVPVTVVDTAGLNQSTRDEIERLGMARSASEIEGADLLVWVSSPDVSAKTRPSVIDSDTLRVLNKGDILDGKWSTGRFDAVISARTGDGIERFVGLLIDRVSAAYQRREPALVTRLRHRNAVAECVAHIDDVLSKPEAPVELIAESLRCAVRELERLIGKVDVEDLLDVIFRDFCIGK